MKPPSKKKREEVERETCTECTKASYAAMQYIGSTFIPLCKHFKLLNK